MTTKLTISKQVRQAVEASELSRAEICRRSKIDQGAMSRFMSGGCDFRMATLDVLADVLDLELRPRARATRRPKHGKATK